MQVNFLRGTLLSLLIMLSTLLHAQNTVSPQDLQHLNNMQLRKLQTLLLKWQKDTMVWDQLTGETWQMAKLYVDEKGQQLVHKIRPFEPGDSSNTWTVTYRIPLRQIISMSDGKDYVLIKAKPSSIVVYEADYVQPAGSENEMKIPFHNGRVRNLSGQLMQTLNEYFSSIK